MNKFKSDYEFDKFVKEQYKKELRAVSVKSLYGNGSKVREARIDAGYSLAAASELLGVPIRTFRAWENGERIPPTYVERMILEKLKDIKSADLIAENVVTKLVKQGIINMGEEVEFVKQVIINEMTSSHHL